MTISKNKLKRILYNSNKIALHLHISNKTLIKIPSNFYCSNNNKIQISINLIL